MNNVFEIMLVTYLSVGCVFALVKVFAEFYRLHVGCLDNKTVLKDFQHEFKEMLCLLGLDIRGITARILFLFLCIIVFVINVITWPYVLATNCLP